MSALHGCLSGADRGQLLARSGPRPRSAGHCRGGLLEPGRRGRCNLDRRCGCAQHVGSWPRPGLRRRRRRHPDRRCARGCCRHRDRRDPTGSGRRAQRRGTAVGPAPFVEPVRPWPRRTRRASHPELGRTQRIGAALRGSCTGDPCPRTQCWGFCGRPDRHRPHPVRSSRPQPWWRLTCGPRNGSGHRGPGHERTQHRRTRHRTRHRRTQHRRTQADAPQAPEAEQARSGQTRSGQARSGQARSGQAHSGQTRSGQAHSGQTRSGQARSGQAHSGQAHSGQAHPAKPTPAKPTPAKPARPSPLRPSPPSPHRPRWHPDRLLPPEPMWAYAPGSARSRAPTPG